MRCPQCESTHTHIAAAYISETVFRCFHCDHEWFVDIDSAMETLDGKEYSEDSRPDKLA